MWTGPGGVREGVLGEFYQLEWGGVLALLSVEEVGGTADEAAPGVLYCRDRGTGDYEFFAERDWRVLDY